MRCTEQSRSRAEGGGKNMAQPSELGVPRAAKLSDAPLAPATLQRPVLLQVTISHVPLANAVVEQSG